MVIQFDLLIKYSGQLFTKKILFFNNSIILLGFFFFTCLHIISEEVIIRVYILDIIQYHVRIMKPFCMICQYEMTQTYTKFQAERWRRKMH